MLRKKGVVGKFVEFYGPGLADLTLADRATIANMAPEYGATCGFFPIDAETIRYLKGTGRDAARVALVEAYAKKQGIWRDVAHAGPGLHRHARARYVDRRAEPRRAAPAAGPRLAVRCRAGVSEGARRNFQRPADAARVAVAGANHVSATATS